MTQSARYLIDTNVFIQAKNFYYRFGFCQAFWQWLIDAHKAGIVFSIDKVSKEIHKGNKNDLVLLWADTLPDSFFITDVHDSAVMQSYGQVMEWNNSNKHYLKQAKDEFAKFEVADAFMIAAAKAYGFTIVTHEASQPARKSRVLIPDAARELNIDCIMIYDLLSQHATGNFTFTL